MRPGPGRRGGRDGARHGREYRSRDGSAGSRAPLLLAALAALACGPEIAAPPGPPGPPNVVLITLDTTRADHLGLYGYPRDTSPNLDRLAEEARIYTRAVATSNWTLPAHASLFSGRLPSAHGARFDGQGELLLRQAIEGPGGYDAYRVSTLSPLEPTLAERLAEAGYATAGVAGGPWLERVFGLARGFALYADDGIDDIGGVSGARVTDAALGFLAELGPGPFFLFANYFDPHDPRADLPRQRQALGLPEDDGSQERWIELYDAEIRFMDEQIGRLLDALRAAGVWDHTLVIAVGDHGELLGEGGRVGHGQTLREAELHVPLLVKHPRGGPAPGRDNTRVSIAGVFATVLESAGLQVPGWAEPSLERAAAATVVAEFLPAPGRSPDGSWAALYQGQMKLLWNSLGRHRLYDLARDPDEEHDLSSRRRVAARSLEELLQRRLAAAPAAPRPAASEPRTVDPATEEALRKLGYLE